MSMRREQVDKIGSEVETLCFDWRRLHRIVEQLVALPWWDVRSLTCRYCGEPFDINTGACAHDLACVYQSSCLVLGVDPAPVTAERQAGT
jgi:hypothetical protein